MDFNIYPGENGVLVWDDPGQPRGYHGLIIDWQGRANERKKHANANGLVKICLGDKSYLFVLGKL